MITDSLGKSAETGKDSKAGKAHPTQDVSVNRLTLYSLCFFFFNLKI